MGKTLIIAEKPSVGQDYARALGGGFQKHEGYLESDERIVSWAIGHLVELAEPEDYDESLKRWSIKTLPVLPETFKLRPDARGKKQLDVLKRLMKRDDVDEIVNGCDAGREGELIFAYILDVAKVKKPVRRLWVSSMTRAAATVESVKRTERKTRPPLLYDLTSLQRDANSRFGMSASRTLQAAQRLYEGSSAGAVITYPRTRSQFLPSDQIGNLKGIARGLTGLPFARAAARYVAGLDVLPLARVVADAKVDDHHAIIPTGELPTKELSGDDARIYELVVRRFLAVFHPEARFEDTEIV